MEKWKENENIYSTLAKKIKYIRVLCNVWFYRRIHIILAIIRSEQAKSLKEKNDVIF